MGADLDGCNVDRPLQASQYNGLGQPVPVAAAVVFEVEHRRGAKSASISSNLYLPDPDGQSHPASAVNVPVPSASRTTPSSGWRRSDDDHVGTGDAADTAANGDASRGFRQVGDPRASAQRFGLPAKHRQDLVATTIRSTPGMAVEQAPVAGGRIAGRLQAAISAVKHSRCLFDGCASTTTQHRRIDRVI